MCRVCNGIAQTLKRLSILRPTPPDRAKVVGGWDFHQLISEIPTPGAVIQDKSQIIPTLSPTPLGGAYLYNIQSKNNAPIIIIYLMLVCVCVCHGCEFT